MRCLLLLSLIALSYALPYYGGSKTINIGDDGTIVITGANGKRVTISKAVGINDEKFIDISVEGPNLPPKKIRIDEQGTDKTVSVQNGPYSGQFNGQYWEDDMREKRSPKVATATTTKDSKKTKTQADLLSTIFKEYEGLVDEKSYDALLKKVNGYVEAGELDSSITDVLTYMHDQKAIQEQGSTATGVQPSGINKVPVFHSDISSLVKDYIWNNKYQQPGLSSNLYPEQTGFTGQQWTPEQWAQYGWQWSQYGNWPYSQKYAAPQQWVPQQSQWDVQPQPWASQQQQWVPQQWAKPQWAPQPNWPVQGQDWVAQQQWAPKQPSVSQQQWLAQQQWSPEQQFVPQQQQYVPEQPAQQKTSYNPWIAYYLGQIWNQQKQTVAQQSSTPVQSGRVVGYANEYPWFRTPVNEGLVY